MAKVEKGNKVKVHYKGSLDDGSVFDSSEGREPLEFTAGQGQVIPGFDNSVIGMELNETKKVDIPSDEAYGPRRDDMIIEVSKDQLSPDVELKVGMQLGMQTAQGQQLAVQVVEISEDKFKVDGNHPLAGKDLTFEITVQDIS